MRGLGHAVATITVLIGLGGLSACATSGGSQDQKITEVKVAGLWPLSGPNASQGADIMHGAQLAADIVNGDYPGIALPLAAGTGLPGLGGAAIKLVPGDTQGEARIAVDAVETMVTVEKVAAVTGAYQSAVTQAASQRAEQFGVPFVNAESSATSLTGRGLTWFFRTGPTDATFAATMFDYLDAQQRQGRDTRKVAVLHSDDQYGNEGAAVTRTTAATRGATVVADVSIKPKATDLIAPVVKIRDANPDVLFVLAYTDPAVALMKTLKQLNYQPPALLAYGAGFSDNAFVSRLGKLANGVSSRSAWSAELAATRPAAATVARMFQDRYGAPMTEDSARSFTGVLALAQAINNAGSIRPDAIRQGLRTLDIPGDQTIMPWAGIRFDDQGQNTRTAAVVQQLLSGKYRLIYPAAPGAAAPVWPMRQAQSG